MSTDSYELTGYPGLPFVLTCYRLRFSTIMRKILMLGQLSETPKGNLSFFNRLIFVFLAVKRYLTQSFTKTGKLVFCDSNPALDVNRFIGQLILIYLF